MPTQDRAPSFPFYAKDWLADPKVQNLSFANQGKYIHCLASMWEYGDAGCHLPHAIAVKRYGKAWVFLTTDGPSPILILTEENEKGERSLFSNRLYQEAQKCASRREQARSAALAMHAKRRAENDASA